MFLGYIITVEMGKHKGNIDLFYGSNDNNIASLCSASPFTYKNM